VAAPISAPAPFNEMVECFIALVEAGRWAGARSKVGDGLRLKLTYVALRSRRAR
jgi:hypothetical protein